MIESIKIYIKNYEKEITLDKKQDISSLINGEDKTKYIAALVNNETTSLSYTLKVNSTVELLTISDTHGMEVYKRSLAFLLSQVIKKLHPNKRLIIRHSMGPGYYFELDNCELDTNQIKEIKEIMEKEVLQDSRIVRSKMSYTDAIEYFKKNKKNDKLKLISCLNMQSISYYKCGNYIEIFDGPLAPSTGHLKVFDLLWYPPGFILQFPRKSNPTKTAPFKEQRKIFEVYKEYKEWGRILKVDNVGSLNEIIRQKSIDNFILVAEALHERKISQLALDIYKRLPAVKLVTIAGPSSSGKTTFSKKLSIQLQALGIKPITISVDDYFVDRDKTPLDEEGKYNYESINAINIELFNEHLKGLLNGESISPVRYDFFTGKSGLSDEVLHLNKDEIIIIEGIHCLNEKLTYTIPKDNKFKIYISALTQMNIDDTNRIPTTDNRIIRRLIRDYNYRGHSAHKTIDMWPSVRRGEEENIFPFQNDADGYFNSALDYELAILKPFAEMILSDVKPHEKEYTEARRLLNFLSYFLPIPSHMVPPTSIVREFIGGSFFNY